MHNKFLHTFLLTAALITPTLSYSAIDEEGAGDTRATTSRSQNIHEFQDYQRDLRTLSERRKKLDKEQQELENRIKDLNTPLERKCQGKRRAPQRIAKLKAGLAEIKGKQEDVGSAEEALKQKYPLHDLSHELGQIFHGGAASDEE